MATQSRRDGSAFGSGDHPLPETLADAERLAASIERAVLRETDLQLPVTRNSAHGAADSALQRFAVGAPLVCGAEIVSTAGHVS